MFLEKLIAACKHAAGELDGSDDPNHILLLEDIRNLQARAEADLASKRPT